MQENGCSDLIRHTQSCTRVPRLPVAVRASHASCEKTGKTRTFTPVQQSSGHNVASAFEFARRLLQVRDPQDLFMLQTEFIRAQMQAMVEP